jgi:predicted nucleic acid-binding protein
MNRYCIDTSAIIQPLKRYPMDVFPSVWEHLSALVVEERLSAPDHVLNELRRKSDTATAWGEAHQGIFVETDERLFLEVRKVIALFPRIVERRKSRSQADPFVIAHAKIHGLVCVTEEEPGDATNVRIPFVCGELSVVCINFLEMLRREGWRF